WSRVGTGGLRRRPLGSDMGKGPHVLFALGNTIKTRLEVIGRCEGAAGDLFECSPRVVSIDPRDRHRNCLPRLSRHANAPRHTKEKNGPLATSNIMATDYKIENRGRAD